MKGAKSPPTSTKKKEQKSLVLYSHPINNIYHHSRGKKRCSSALRVSLVAWASAVCYVSVCLSVCLNVSLLAWVVWLSSEMWVEWPRVRVEALDGR